MQWFFVILNEYLVDNFLLTDLNEHYLSAIIKINVKCGWHITKTTALQDKKREPQKNAKISFTLWLVQERNAKLEFSSFSFHLANKYKIFNTEIQPKRFNENIF